MISPEVFSHTSEALLSLAPFFLAFSVGTWKQIHLRDQVDAWDGSSENLEIAHITHDKSHPRYDHKSNGRLLSRRNHYRDHVNTVGRNGLTLAQNNWALREIWKRLSEEERVGLMPPPEDNT